MSQVINDLTKVSNVNLISKLSFYAVNKLTPTQLNFIVQSKKQVTFQMTIDKQIAETILLLNTKNRQINEKHLIFLKKQILDNAWVFNAQSISISNENTLLDGQHRLTAVVKTDKEIVSNVSFGVNQNTFSTIDTGVVRYAKDTLYLNGYNNVANLSSAIKLISNYNANRISETRGRESKMTNEQTLQFAKKHSIEYWNGLIKQASLYYKNHGVLMGISCSEIASFLYLIKDADQTKIDNFCKIIFLGLDRKEDTFINFLAKKLIDAKKNKMSSIPYAIKMAYLYKAWNMFLDNSKAKKVLYNPESETYPRLKIS
jgi:hypothetical protein